MWSSFIDRDLSEQEPIRASETRQREASARLSRSFRISCKRPKIGAIVTFLVALMRKFALWR